MNYIFNYIFIGEAALKIYVFRCSYFNSGWNLLDFICASETVLNSLILSSILQAE